MTAGSERLLGATHKSSKVVAGQEQWETEGKRDDGGAVTLDIRLL